VKWLTWALLAPASRPAAVQDVTTDRRQAAPYTRTAWLVALVACGSPARDHDPGPQDETASPKRVPPPLDAAVPSASPSATLAQPDRPPQTTPDLDCFANGPKEYIRIVTDKVALTGVLSRLTTRPVPDRQIRYRAVADGTDAFDLVFDGYAPGDYVRTSRHPPSPKREQLIKGKSLIARVALVQGESRLFVDREVDLGRGMIVPPDRGSYPCR
jgi:hypothetical protein